MSRITYIVSSFNRPEMLDACLATLRVQAGDRRIFVTCNSIEPSMVRHLRCVSENAGAAFLHTAAIDGIRYSCYDAANYAVQKWGIEFLFDEWLCFPSEDSLYVADFAAIMNGAGEPIGADLVYCDMIYRATRSLAWKPYSLLSSEPRMRHIDKTGFIVRHHTFSDLGGFPGHGRDWRDGALVEKVVQSGIKYVKAPGILVVHQ